MGINRNMRCIEIYAWWSWFESGGRLIETWDVLKLNKWIYYNSNPLGLIETWDVLKYGIDMIQLYRKKD